MHCWCTFLIICTVSAYFLILCTVSAYFKIKELFQNFILLSCFSFLFMSLLLPITPLPLPCFHVSFVVLPLFEHLWHTLVLLVYINYIICIPVFQSRIELTSLSQKSCVLPLSHTGRYEMLLKTSLLCFNTSTIINKMQCQCIIFTEDRTHISFTEVLCVTTEPLWQIWNVIKNIPFMF